MEEIKGLMPLVGCDYDKENDEFTAWKLAGPMGVVAFIDNMKELHDSFSEPDEVEVFAQMLSQQIAEHYRLSNKFEDMMFVSYKTDGDINFKFKGVTIGNLYGGYVLVAHYEYLSTIS